MLESWASIYANHAALRTGILFMHIGGLLAGGGSAITVDLATIKAHREGAAARAAHLHVLQRTHTLVVVGLVGDRGQRRCCSSAPTSGRSCRRESSG